MKNDISEERVSDICINYLSKLKMLSKLQIIDGKTYSQNSKSYEMIEFKYDINDYSVCNLLKSCSFLRSIKFDFISNISHKTINAFIEIAIRNLDKSYEFLFKTINKINFHYFYKNDVKIDPNLSDYRKTKPIIETPINLSLYLCTFNDFM